MWGIFSKKLRFWLKDKIYGYLKTSHDYNRQSYSGRDPRPVARPDPPSFQVGFEDSAESRESGLKESCVLGLVPEVDVVPLGPAVIVVPPTARAYLAAEVSEVGVRTTGLCTSTSSGSAPIPTALRIVAVFPEGTLGFTPVDGRSRVEGGSRLWQERSDGRVNLNSKTSKKPVSENITIEPIKAFGESVWPVKSSQRTMLIGSTQRM